jgi:hypothetical protein
MKKFPGWPLVACFLVLGSSGCEPKSESNSLAVGDPAQLEREVLELRKAIANYTEALSKQSGEIEFLKLQLEWMQSKSIRIDVSAQTYQCIDTNTAKFLIACDNVQPYAEGQKLSFRVGNPNFITFSGFQLKVKWGVKSPNWDQFAKEPDGIAKWQVANANWQKSLHEREINSPIDLRPGIWNTVEIVLSPARADELGYLELSMLTDKVLLARDKPK